MTLYILTGSDDSVLEIKANGLSEAIAKYINDNHGDLDKLVSIHPQATPDDEGEYTESAWDNLSDDEKRVWLRFAEEQYPARQNAPTADKIERLGKVLFLESHSKLNI